MTVLSSASALIRLFPTTTVTDCLMAGSATATAHTRWSSTLTRMGWATEMRSLSTKRTRSSMTWIRMGWETATSFSSTGQTRVIGTRTVTRCLMVRKRIQQKRPPRAATPTATARTTTQSTITAARRWTRTTRQATAFSNRTCSVYVDAWGGLLGPASGKLVSRRNANGACPRLQRPMRAHVQHVCPHRTLVTSGIRRHPFLDRQHEVGGSAGFLAGNHHALLRRPCQYHRHWPFRRYPAGDIDRCLHPGVNPAQRRGGCAAHPLKRVPGEPAIDPDA